MNYLKILTNDNFKVLSCLYNNKDKQNIIKLTQSEVAEIVGVSRATINIIFKLLKQENLIKYTNHVGRYEITSQGIKAIELFKKINK